jgi:hypothetical protein
MDEQFFTASTRSRPARKLETLRAYRQ